MTNIAENIRKSDPQFSFEILPPLRGNSIHRVYSIIDKLREFDPAYINITAHHSESIFVPQPDGSHRKKTIRRRPGTVAIASAIQNKYGIPAVPHIICRGFSKEETEYALMDLNFLGINNLLLLRGDAKSPDVQNEDPEKYHEHAMGLQLQVNDFNKGIAIDGSELEGIETPFSYGMACYPEKHEEAPNMEIDLEYARRKVELGASYLVTQMFFDNEKYFEFVERCRGVGIRVPIVPGIKPVTKMSQMTVLPRVFHVDIPEAFASELRKAKSDREASMVGVEWCTEQCRELLRRGVPGVHFYTHYASDSVRTVCQKIF
ncbi:MAG: methylenetetrahydrofolate reductase [Prevotella sp.]|nr:methylenetetrahydrofolate reductase [Bacteroides sp.]MCM1366928.1 methylenetetrahydrofolate reductase [Prevotella sp.]MCM1437459.1 methylenetetrahydrofolate reductase [Prevotella sp.]